MKRSKFQKKIVNLVGAISFGVALFLSLNLFAQKEGASGEVGKSEKLLLEGHRREAIELILKELKSHKKKTKKYESLRKLLDKASNLFYSEKGQKLFEQGNSFFTSKPTRAFDLFAEANQIEPNNIQILLALSRSQLFLKKCSEALSYSEKVLELNPLDESGRILQLKALSCLGEKEGARAIIVGPLFEARSAQAEAQYFSLSMDLEEGQIESRDTERLFTAQRQFQDYPEFYWLIWRTQKGENKVRAAQNYISHCNQALQKLLRKYPDLVDGCQKVSELESYLNDQKSQSIDSHHVGD